MNPALLFAPARYPAALVPSGVRLRPRGHLNPRLAARHRGGHDALGERGDRLRRAHVTVHLVGCPRFDDALARGAGGLGS